MPAAGGDPTIRLANVPAELAGQPFNWDDSDNIGPSHWPIGGAQVGPEFRLSLGNPGFGLNGTFSIDSGPGQIGARSNPAELRAGHGYEWDVSTGGVEDLNPAAVIEPPDSSIGKPGVPVSSSPLDGLKDLVAGLPAPLNNPLVAGLAAFVVLRVLGGKKLF